MKCDGYQLFLLDFVFSIIITTENYLSFLTVKFEVVDAIKKKDKFHRKIQKVTT